MLTYSKKVSDSVILPQINQPKNSSKSAHRINSQSLRRGKSIGKSFETSFNLLA